MSRLPPDFRAQKRTLALWILGLGTGLALLWCAWESFVMGKGYPESYLLGSPFGRFGDFTDETLVSKLPNPYTDPTSFYPPPTYLFFWLLSFSDSFFLIAIDYLSLLALAYLLLCVTQPVTPGKWIGPLITYIFLAFSYPVIFCIDRGNIEIVLAALVAWSAYFYSSHRDTEATACLFPAICLKLYPAILLVLLLRRGKAGLILATGIASVLVITLSCFCYGVPAGVIWSGYQDNLHYYRDNVLTTNTLEGAASPWNAFKIALLGLQSQKLISPINFGFDGSFIISAYRVYSIVLALLALTCALYAWLYERHVARSILLLLLFISIAAPSGADYRLIYASIALLLMVLLPQRRRGDLVALVLVALAVIPKKEVLLTFAGTTETGFADVPIQAVLNPIFILTAMAILLYQSRHPFDWRWTKKNLRDLHPLRWRWA